MALPLLTSPVPEGLECDWRTHCNSKLPYRPAPCYWVSDHVAPFRTYQSNFLQLNLLLHPVKVSHRVLHLVGVLARILSNLNRGLVVFRRLGSYSARPSFGSAQLASHLSAMSYDFTAS